MTMRESRVILTSCLPAAAGGDVRITRVDGGRLVAAAAGTSQRPVEDCRSCCPSLDPRRSLLPTAEDSAAREATRCSCTADRACCRCSCRQTPPPRPLADLA